MLAARRAWAGLHGIKMGRRLSSAAHVHSEQETVGATAHELRGSRADAALVDGVWEGQDPSQIFSNALYSAACSNSPNFLQPTCVEPGI